MSAHDSHADIDPMSLPLPELRSLRERLQGEDDAVSYVRRMVQARLDLAKAEVQRRASAEGASLADTLPSILGSQLTGGAPRPPRPTGDYSDHPLAQELETLCADAGSTDLESMSDDELGGYVQTLFEFEQARSAERKALFGRIDALSAELVRRYRDGEASVDGLLADD